MSSTACYNLHNYQSISISDDGMAVVGVGAVSGQYWNGWLGARHTSTLPYTEGRQYQTEKGEESVPPPPEAGDAIVQDDLQEDYRSQTWKYYLNMDSMITHVQFLDKSTSKRVFAISNDSLYIYNVRGESFAYECCTKALDFGAKAFDVNCDGSKCIHGELSGRISIRNTEDLTVIRSYLGHSDAVYACAYNTVDPQIFLSSSMDGTTILWDMRSAKPASFISAYNYDTTAIAWQPDSSNMFAIGSETGAYKLMDTATCMISSSVDTSTSSCGVDIMSESSSPHNSAIRQLCFSRDGRHLTAISEDCVFTGADLSGETITARYVDKSRHRHQPTCIDYCHTTDTFYTTTLDGQILTTSVDEIDEAAINKAIV